MLVVGIVIWRYTMKLIPDSFWQNCQTCIGKGHARTCRPGSPAECATTGWIFEMIVGLILAGIVVGLLKAIFRFVLKLVVYKLSALVVETAVRAVA